MKQRLAWLGLAWLGMVAGDASAADCRLGRKYNKTTVNQVFVCLNSEVNALLAELGAANGRLSSVTKTVAGLGDTSGLPSQIAALSNQINSATGRLASAENELKTLRASVAAINPSGGGSNNAAISALQTDVGTIKTDLGTIKTRLQAVETSLTTVRADLTTVKNGLGGLENRMTSVENQLTVVQNDITFLKTNAPPTDTIGVYSDSFMTVRVTGSTRRIDPNTSKVIRLDFGMEIQNTGTQPLYIANFVSTGGIPDNTIVQEDGTGKVCSQELAGLSRAQFGSTRSSYSLVAPQQSLFVTWAVGDCGFIGTGTSYNLTVQMLRFDSANGVGILVPFSFKHQIVR